MIDEMVLLCYISHKFVLMIKERWKEYVDLVLIVQICFQMEVLYKYTKYNTFYW